MCRRPENQREVGATDLRDGIGVQFIGARRESLSRKVLSRAGEESKEFRTEDVSLCLQE